MATPISPNSTGALKANAETQAKEQAIEIVEKQKLFPNTPGWDWVPFVTAIALSGLLIKPPSGKNLDDEPVPKPDVIAVDPTKVKPRIPGPQRWNYVYYAPSWTHPNFNERFFQAYDGDKRLRMSTDPVTHLRPALRPEDLIRNPTMYATRFGIHPDELGGRSHLSPTIAPSRNPLDDFANQVNMLGDVAKQQAIDETRRRGMGNPQDPNHIDPVVLGDLLNNAGILAGITLQARLLPLLDAGNLEQAVDDIKNNDQRIFDANKNYLEGALKDQDYQRFLFSEMTTDELIKGNIHTMSDRETSNLTGPLHPWVGKGHWSGSSWKGSEKETPVHMYTLNGERKEWDVWTNPDLWEALQPALQLVTRVLNSDHPHFRYLMDMNTRQRIPNDQDFRDDEDEENPPSTAFLYNFVPLHKADPEKSFEGIQKLANRGFDWESHVKRIMDEDLTIDIVSCHWEPTDGIEEDLNTHYGISYTIPNEGRSQIFCCIAAEVLWPLLQPGFSESEKLAASFIAASILLHELAHCMSWALISLCNYRAAHTPDMPKDISDELLNIGNDVFDMKTWAGEHPYEDCGEAEHGNQLEMELWGWTIGSLLGGVSTLSWDMAMHSLIARGSIWPSSVPEYGSTLFECDSWPMDDYEIPLPIDYFAKFFRQEFWETDFLQYGHGALKHFPNDRVHKIVMRPNYPFSTTGRTVFGEVDYRFLHTVWTQLRVHGYPILGLYLKDAYLWAVKRTTYPRRWTKDLNRWTLVNCNLDAIVYQLVRDFRTAQGINTIRTGDYGVQISSYKRHLEYRNQLYFAGKTTAPQLNFNSWRYNIEQTWRDFFMNHGKLMRQMAEAFRLMQRDLAFMQRMLLDYFSLTHDIRNDIYKGGGSADLSPIGAGIGRMEGFLRRSDEIAQFAYDISRIPQLDSIQGEWQVWSRRFRANHAMYYELLQMFQPGQNIDPDDMGWKAQMTSVPSSHWKKRSDRLSILAMNQYQRVDVRIRDALDRASQIIDKVAGTPLFEPDPDPAELTSIITKMQVQNAKLLNANIFGLPAAVLNAGDPSQPAFEGALLEEIEKAAAANGTDQFNVAPNAAEAVAASAIPGANNGIVFGQTSQLTGAAPPQINFPKSMPTASPPTSLAVIPLNTTGIGVGAGGSAGINANIFKSSPNPAPFPFIGVMNISAYPPDQPPNPALRPFPNPYSRAGTASSDVANDVVAGYVRFQRDLAIAAANPFTTNEPWREMGVGRDSSSSSGSSPSGIK